MWAEGEGQRDERNRNKHHKSNKHTNICTALLFDFAIKHGGGWFSVPNRRLLCWFKPAVTPAAWLKGCSLYNSTAQVYSLQTKEGSQNRDAIILCARVGAREVLASVHRTRSVSRFSFLSVYFTVIFVASMQIQRQEPLLSKCPSARPAG